MDMRKAENQQNSEVASGTMHDIPLSKNTDEQQQQAERALGSIPKIPSKSSSLKRFFKLNLSKKSSNESSNENLGNDSADADIEDGNEEVPSQLEREMKNQEPLKDNIEEIKRTRSRRFNFRFHGNNNNSNADNEAPSGSGHPPSMSRHSLRGSFSTYFNSVFKRRQGGASKHAVRSAKKDDAKSKEENEIKEEMSQNKTTEESESYNVETQTAEVINELESLTISEQSSIGAAPIPLHQA